MSARRCTVDGCQRGAHQGYVCSACTRGLAELLTSYPPTDPDGDPGIRALLADLEVSLSREARVGAGPGAQSSETPLAFGYHAAEASWLLGNVLGSWTRDLCERRALVLPLVLVELATWPRALVRRSLPRPELVAACAWFLVAHQSELRQLPDAGDAVMQIRAAYAQAVAAVDRAPDRTYLVCERCGTDLLVDPQAHHATCRSCGWSHSVDRRKSAMLAQVRGHLGTATEVSRLLGKTFGIQVTPALISTWWQRGKLAVRGTTPQARNLYRIGDVIDLASAG